MEKKWMAAVILGLIFLIALAGAAFVLLSSFVTHYGCPRYRPKVEQA